MRVYRYGPCESCVYRAAFGEPCGVRDALIVNRAGSPIEYGLGCSMWNCVEDES